MWVFHRGGGIGYVIARGGDRGQAGGHVGEGGKLLKHLPLWHGAGQLMRELNSSRHRFDSSALRGTGRHRQSDGRML